jgi:hypothetical protein
VEGWRKLAVYHGTINHQGQAACSRYYSRGRRILVSSVFTFECILSSAYPLRLCRVRDCPETGTSNEVGSCRTTGWLGG